MRHLLIVLFSLGPLLFGGGVRADGEFLVIATTPGVEGPLAGVTLSSGDALAVPRNAVVTLIGRDGRVLQLVGPCDCVLPVVAGAAGLARPAPLALDPSTASSPPADDGATGRAGWDAAAPGLLALFALKTRALEVLGKPRDLRGAAGRQPGLWLLAIDNAGDRCVKQSDVFMWRKRAGEAVAIDLRGLAGQLTGLTWSAGEHRMALPAGFVADGHPVIIKISGEPRRFTLHVLPPVIDEADWGKILIWMAASACRGQAQFLVDGLHDGSLFPDAVRRPGMSEL